MSRAYLINSSGSELLHVPEQGTGLISRLCAGEREFEQNRFATQQHRSLLQQMANSAFCLIMPGNSQSSQRLTEAFLTGCIPVFIGPPWHSLPLTQKVHLLRSRKDAPALSGRAPLMLGSQFQPCHGPN